MINKFRHDIVLKDNKILNTICGMRYLRELNENNDFDAEIVRIEQEARVLPTIHNTFDTCYIYIIISQKCNLRCIYCFEKNSDYKMHKYNSMSFDIQYYMEFISAVEKLYRNVCVVLYGGEPLLKENYGAIERIFKFLKNKRIRVRIISNGTLLDQYLNLLREYNFIENITISLDGTRDIHDIRRKNVKGAGTYKKIISNVKLALSICDFPIRIRVNLDYDNIKFQEQLVEELLEIDDGKLSICYYRTTNNTNSYSDDKVLSLSKFSEVLDHILDKYKDKIKIESGVNIYNHIKELLECDYIPYPRLAFCEYGYIYILNCDGYIYTCGETVKEENFRLCHICEFIKEPFLHKQPKQISILTDDIETMCSECEVNTICGGGCNLAKENKAFYCEKEEIIKAINEMYIRRKKVSGQ